MKKMFYVTPSLDLACAFIEANTDWKKVTSVSFRNGDENIIIIDSLMRMRGHNVDGVYIDYSFSSIPPSIKHELQQRFDLLGIHPVCIEQSEASV